MRVVLLFALLACSKSEPKGAPAPAVITVDAAPMIAAPMSDAAIDAVASDARPSLTGDPNEQWTTEDGVEVVTSEKAPPMWCLVAGALKGFCYPTLEVCKREGKEGRGYGCGEYKSYACLKTKNRTDGAIESGCFRTHTECVATGKLLETRDFVVVTPCLVVRRKAQLERAGSSGAREERK